MAANQAVAAMLFAGVEQDAVDKIVRDNTIRLFGLTFDRRAR
ncbi:MAG TPA: hypothetical protein VKH36_11090 [Acidimicrobiia bacterium]|nr:hypothetical protein [Acidimicrobiia bacterium]